MNRKVKLRIESNWKYQNVLKMLKTSKRLSRLKSPAKALLLNRWKIVILKFRGPKTNYNSLNLVENRRKSRDWNFVSYE